METVKTVDQFIKFFKENNREIFPLSEAEFDHFVKMFTEYLFSTFENLSEDEEDDGIMVDIENVRKVLFEETIN